MFKSIKYKLKAIFGSSLKRINKSITMCHERSGKSKISIFFSMLYCFVRFGAGHNDYRLFAFYDMTNKERDTYLTRFRSKKIVEALNDQEKAKIIDHKGLFNERFKDYLFRDTLALEKTSLKEFESFIDKHNPVLCKPYLGDSGRGIEKLDKKDFKSTKEMYEYIKDKEILDVEEIAKQHKDMNKVNPYCVNCLRLVTVVTDGSAEVIYAVVKFGVGDHFVDNMGFGAISCPIDLETGKIKYDGQTEHEEVVSVHPISKIKFKGYQIPLFKEAVELAKKAALEVPEVRQIGWDICVGEKTPLIIEGNDWTDYMFWQLPVHTPDKVGLMPYYRKILPNIKL